MLVLLVHVSAAFVEDKLFRELLRVCKLFRSELVVRNFDFIELDLLVGLKRT